MIEYKHFNLLSAVGDMSYLTDKSCILSPSSLSNEKWKEMPMYIPTDPLLDSYFCPVFLTHLPSWSLYLFHFGFSSITASGSAQRWQWPLIKCPQDSITHRIIYTAEAQNSTLPYFTNRFVWPCCVVTCVSVCFAWVQPRSDILWMQLLTDSTRGGSGGGVVPWLQIESQSTSWTALKRSDRWIPVQRNSKYRNYLWL